MRVNEPLRLNGASVYLLGHGYAPVLRYTDRYGTTFEQPVPFLPTDAMLTSTGVAKFPNANVDPSGAVPPESTAQVGFAGVYLPTLPDNPDVGRSAFPAERDPRTWTLEKAALGSYEVVGCDRVIVDQHGWLDVRLRRLTHCYRSSDNVL